MASIEPASPGDCDAICQLLLESRLPVQGLVDHLAHALVARDGTRIVGIAALEVYAGGALLRSVAVHAGARGQGLGQQLVEAAVERARRLKLPAIYLLTETAEGFFPRFGFERVTRADVPDEVRRSVEFVSLCPASSAVMRLPLT